MPSKFKRLLITPIIKVTKGKKSESFYNLTDYSQWKEKKKDSKKWHIKYYKGLGTSSSSEARDYFKNIKMNNYVFTEETNDSMNLAFNKNLSDMRKTWLYSYNENNILNHSEIEIPIQDFINKELIHFSNSDTLRSIGSINDGLKPSQRKILYSCFKRKLYSEIKVAQLSGYVSENSAYHHGEMSLQSAIICMAQNFVGSNNINLLMPNGQFGTRIMGGQDSASSRYIHTELNKIVDKIYPSLDFPLLTYNDDDGMLVEPKYYVPIIPMVLVNGMNGIGTGFSTSVPKYNPVDIINNVKKKIKGEPYNEIRPWYSGFKGEILKLKDNTYLSKGRYEILSPTIIKITELPIGKWTDDYKKFLDTLLPEEKKSKSKENEKNKGKKKIKRTIVDYVNNSTDTTVDFEIIVSIDFIKSVQWSEDENIDGIENYFKLYTTKGLSLNNIHLYDKNNKIIKIKDINEIFDIHYEERYELYVKRKDYIVTNLSNDLEILKSKIRFIEDVINDTIVIYKRKKQDIINDLFENKYPGVINKKIVKYKNKNEYSNGYDYLTKMSIELFTEEEIIQLKKEYEKIKFKYDTILKKTIEDLWLEECSELMKEYRKFKINI